MLFFSAFGQVSLQDSAITMATLNITYRGGATGGQWQNRWAFVSQLGMDVAVKFKPNIYLQTGASFLFTDRIEADNSLDNLLTADNTLIVTDEGFLSEVAISGRGLAIPLSIGYIIPVLGPNPNSGIYVEAGGQYLTHRYNYRVVDGDASAIEGDYAKGYDRMRHGFGFREGIGYTYFANKNGVNFSAGLDFFQVPTISGRQVFFPTGPLDTETSTLDMFWGIKFSWIYTLYRRAPSKSYFY